MAASVDIVLRARYVVPMDGPPIENGAVEIRDGIVAAVGRSGDVLRSAVEDLGDVVLFPGLVNAHTHLELTHLAGRVPTDGGFLAWIERLVKATKAYGDAPPVIRASLRTGVQESLRAGVTAVGDITRQPELTRPLLRDGPLRTVSFGEVIAVGRLRRRLAERLEAAAGARCASSFLRIGISPHAPYTMEADGLRACVERAEQDGLPLSMHLAETPDEERFTQDLSGPAREYLERVGVWDDDVPCPGQRPVEFSAACGVLSRDTVLAHGNYVADADIEVIARSGAHVAYCPRTHRAFGHPPHRFRDMLTAGINVCVGTDSLASAPSLSILEELRFVHRAFADVPSRVLFEMGTRRGARALGLDGRVGSLSPGKEADLTAVPYDPAGPKDPLLNVLESAAPPVATYVRGIPLRAWR